MAPIVYEASVFSQDVSYKNFKGESKTTTLHFALDPIQLLATISGYQPKKIKSGNPALNGKDADMTEEDQIKMVQGLAAKAAGTPSEDGENWIPFEDFNDSIAGKAFLTKLVSSDEDRKNFSQKVVMDPFRAYVAYAMADESNSAAERKELQDMLDKMERVFITPDPANETPEERRTRLQAEIASLESE